MNKHPIAVLTSDVHYSLANLKLADAAMRMVISKANELGVPLIVAGDLHDTKANLRGECVKAIRDTMRTAKKKPYILIGNHDKINEKSEWNEHSLHFLGRLVHIVSYPHSYNGLFFIPYQHDKNKFVDCLCRIPSGSAIITHQGYSGSNSGEYFHDKSAIDPIYVKRFRVVSGHYHTRQTIGSNIDYIGNPYTLTWAEANDPPKGFQVLYNDGSLEFVPTNLRKHVVMNYSYTHEPPEWDLMLTDHCLRIEPDDLVWIKVKGTHEALSRVTRSNMAKLIGRESFKLDLIPTDVSTGKNYKEISNIELIDTLIDSLTNTTDARKNRLKKLWRNLKSDTQ